MEAKKNDSGFVNIDNTTHRPDNNQYGSVIAQIAKDGVCPFCPEQLAKYHKNPILIETKYWLVTENMYPYKSTVHHFLLIHKNHIGHMSEVSTEAWKDLEDLNNEVFRKYNVKGGTFMMRFGDNKITGASVAHLHAHIIVSSGEASREPILARVG